MDSLMEAPTIALHPERDRSNQPQAIQSWSPAGKMLFRIGCVYLFVYNFPFPIDYIPVVGETYNLAMRKSIAWISEHAFQIPITVFTNGSGDTTFNYIQVLCFCIFAVVAASLWALIDRRRPNYERLRRWLRIYVRYALASSMLSYGAVKVIKEQFPDPSYSTLIETFGEASPMKLLWTFMGASTLYTFFAGAGEVLGGLLLLFPRTATLGGIVSAGVLANIVVMNFSYDVPVKLYSSHLLVMAVFVMSQDFKRLANLLVLNRPTVPAQTPALFRRRWMNRAAAGFAIAFSLLLVGFPFYDALETQKDISLLKNTPFYGVWEVEEFDIDGVPAPPLITDPKRWRYVSFENPKYLGIKSMTDVRQFVSLTLDSSKKTMTLGKSYDPKWKAVLTYSQPEKDILTLEGKINGSLTRARLRRIDASKFLLLSRGFHWVNEYPYNR